MQQLERDWFISSSEANQEQPLYEDSELLERLPHLQYDQQQRKQNNGDEPPLKAQTLTAR